MKKTIIFFIVFGIFTTYSILLPAQEKFISKNAKIHFFSHAPLEDIKAECTRGGIILNTQTNEVMAVAAIRSFIFEKGLMQEHFNENYMESDKYKEAKLKGKIVETIDYNKEGTYPVTVKGTFDIHGVQKEREIPATLTIKGGKIMVTSEFIVPCKDHDIKIEAAKLQNINENIKVNIEGELEPIVKK